VTAPVVDAQPLIAAVARAITDAQVTFAEAVKPANVGTKPYVVGFFDTGSISDRSLRSRDGLSFVGTFQCAGLTPESARVAVRRLRAALLGLHLTVAGGRQFLMPEHLVGVPMDRDDDADPPLFIAVDEWRFRTTAA
jgi:hypothetical protein